MSGSNGLPKLRENRDEQEALELVCKGFDRGRGKYGPLDLDTDKRDWLDESIEEARDLTNYLHFYLLKIRRARDSRRETKGPVIGLDFDSTVVTGAYPKIGEPLPHAIDTLIEAQELGARIVLYTMRDGAELADAVVWLRRHGIRVWAANRNPTQHAWTQSPKAYCDFYVDDRNVGTPLDAQGDVDWVRLAPILIDKIKRWNHVPLTDGERYSGDV